MKSQTYYRCAIYIRVNVASGLASIQAQREATQEFIESRTLKGWTCVGTCEDISRSAGTLGRPALRTLLADIRADKLDCVVVHTIDRLTPSEADLYWRYPQNPVVAALRNHGSTRVTMFLRLAGFAKSSSPK